MENSNKYACKFYLLRIQEKFLLEIFVWSDNKEIRSGNETDDIIKGLLNSFLTNYQNEMEVILYLKVLIYCLIVFIK